MKNSTKLVLFVFIVTLGIVVINNSLLGMTKHCWCVEEIDVYQTCEEYCEDAHSSCLYVFASSTGCHWDTCVTHWTYECENRVKGYIYSWVDNCPDCEDYPE